MIRGGDGDDVLLGGPGQDVLDGGTGDNILIQGEDLISGTVVGQSWLTNHTHVTGSTTVLENDRKNYTIPAGDLLF